MTSKQSDRNREYLPDLTRPPTKLAFVYVGDFVPEIEDEVLGRIQSHDVVLVARGRELASYMAKRLNYHKHGRWVVDYVDGTARERYLTWLGVLAARHPRAEALLSSHGRGRLRAAPR